MEEEEEEEEGEGEEEEEKEEEEEGVFFLSKAPSSWCRGRDPQLLAV